MGIELYAVYETLLEFKKISHHIPYKGHIPGDSKHILWDRRT